MADYVSSRVYYLIEYYNTTMGFSQSFHLKMENINELPDRKLHSATCTILKTLTTLKKLQLF